MTDGLAEYAMREEESRGRKHAEPPHPFRGLYQRDRERIVHSSAFRRMTGKTQVLVATVNDHHRTRLTHTLEVTQVARTVARRLQLNEDLTEAIALAHDIGHPPFGHAGEDALDKCLESIGGFDHNLYGLRRVDTLEERYPEFPGLNLSFETREAFVRHSGNFDAEEAVEFQNLGEPLLEAQVVDMVDSIAYVTHDIDDALSLGFITLDDLAGLELWQLSVTAVNRQHNELKGPAFRTAIVRDLLARQVTDLLDETATRLADGPIRNLADVRQAKKPLVGFTQPIERAKRELEQFLRDSVYRHHRVLGMTAGGKRVLSSLFGEYTANPELLPEKHFRRWSGADRLNPPRAELILPNRVREQRLERVVGDYLAGMTDRYALQQFQRLFQPRADI